MFFELDDIKRRHSYTFDVYNVFSWIDTPENKLTWNWQRGAIAGVIASTVVNDFWRLIPQFLPFLERNVNPLHRELAIVAERI